MTEEKVENSRQIVISPEECKGALEFFKHFEIPIPAGLQAAVDAFAKEQTFENQEELKFHLVKTISTSDHEAFKEDMFKRIIEECKSVSFDMAFDRDLEETLTEEKKPELT